MADLERFAGHATEPVPPTHDDGVADSGAQFLAQEALETADALEPIARGGGAATASALEASLAHIRTLRGVAAVHDMPPLSETLDSVERLARSLVLSRSAPNAGQAALIAAAAALLRRAAGDLNANGIIETGTPEEARFMTARDALAATDADGERIVPIADLFYSDGRDGVVSRAASPPTTLAERFRLEVVSLAEHLQALVRNAESAGPGPVPDATTVELRTALQSVQRAAESFGERDVAFLLATFTEGHPVFDFLTLHALDELATSLAEQPGEGEELTRRVAQLVQGRALDVGIALGLGASTETLTRRDKPPARAAETKTRERPRTPTGTDLQAFLADGIAGIAGLGELPMIDDAFDMEPMEPAAPVAAGASALLRPPTPARGAVSQAPASATGASVVPIESLLYRGESALSRARVIRDTLRDDPAPPPDALAELYDLLDLAAPA